MQSACWCADDRDSADVPENNEGQISKSFKAPVGALTAATLINALAAEMENVFQSACWCADDRDAKVYGVSKSHISKVSKRLLVR